MAIYKTLQTGSTGDEVKKLQSSLKSAGYDVGEAGADGIYGPATERAVRRYQTDKGLKVDGIAGEQTQGSLLGSGEKTGEISTGASETGVDNGLKTLQAYDPGTDRDYQQALSRVEAVRQEKPEYEATYDRQLEALYDEIVNRRPFSYNINEDALYQQYKDQYVAQGKLAMQDTMGQAAALTGGYGNSYGQNLGQQAYQGYLRQLNNIVPELYSLAQNRYDQEGQKLMNQYAMLGDMADTEYGRYQDRLNQYRQDLSYAQDQADTAYDRGYTNWYNAYQQQRDETADRQWQAEFDENKRRYDQEWAYAMGKTGGSGGSGGGSDEWKARLVKHIANDSIENTLSKMQDSKVKSALEVDMNSVSSLGYGELTEEALDALVASGEVEEYIEGNMLKFRRVKKNSM